MRIAIHDYAGHPFQFELSRTLARRGHVVRHFFFAEDAGPKGASEVGPDDPEGFSIEPVSIGGTYSKSSFIRRRNADLRYGRIAGRRISAFAPDVVISGNTPSEAQTHIVAATRQAGAAFVFWMQDFYSLAVERILGRRWAGIGALIAYHYKRLERSLLAQSDQVILISEDFKRPLGQFGVPPAKVTVIHNWGALDSIPLRPKANAWARQHGLADKFVFLYSGTLALKHNPDRLWTLARAFESEPDVAVVLAATGVSVDALKARQAAQPLANLTFLPLQPLEVFPDLLGAADAFVALLEDDAGEFSVPSKVLSYLCAGRPILLSAPRENMAASIVERADAGLAVSGRDEAAFLEAARQLRGGAELRTRLGQAGRRYAEAHFDIEAITDQFEAAFRRARGRDHDEPKHARATTPATPRMAETNTH
ncbi:MAG TPA: glycosyltransferase family 4 protein [Caulobacteraceae bacterium]|nr:glycosyltransferase family 4 protein [Caulobacteraceae bacterium]